MGRWLGIDHGTKRMGVAVGGTEAGSYTRKQKALRQDAVAAAAMLRDFLTSDGPARAPRADEIGDSGG